MNVNDAIRTRRSIRSYSTEPIPDTKVDQVLEAAMFAPSAGNAQPWQFVVVTDQGLREKITSEHPHAAMVKQAPVAIVVCGQLTLEKYPANWMLDCSAATQNLMLEAHSLGLGTVWCGIWPSPTLCQAFRELLGMPADVVPLCVVALGIPLENPEPGERFRPERIHRGGW